MAGKFNFFFFFSFLFTICYFYRIHAGVPSTISKTGAMLTEDAFVAALKEYEDDDNTEEDGEDLD